MPSRKSTPKPTAPTLRPEQALALLEPLIARGQKLSNDQNLSASSFKSWHEEATNALVGALGDHASGVDSFRQHRNYVGPLAAYAQPYELLASRREAMANSLASLEGHARQLRVRLSQGSVSVPIRQSRGIFVSHSSKDKDVILDFVDLILESGCGVPHNEIFCSSSSEQGVPPGQYFVPYVREKVRESQLLIAWISPNFYNSPFCMCELGAAWAMLPDGLIPVLVDMSFDDLSGILQGMQALRAVKQSDLDSLRDEVSRKLSLAQRGTAHWQRQRDEFMRRHI